MGQRGPALMGQCGSPLMGQRGSALMGQRGGLSICGAEGKARSPGEPCQHAAETSPVITNLAFEELNNQ